MLHQIAEDYEVDPVYVLDMYRHGKVSWMLDFMIRAGVGILLLVVGAVIVGGVKKAVRSKEKNAFDRHKWCVFCIVQSADS